MTYVTRGARFGGHSSFKARGPMTDDQLRAVAPSIFATEKHESRSDRFTYIPTFEVLDGLRKAGFLPVAAIQGRSRVEGKAEFTKHMVRLQHPDFMERRDIAGVKPEVVLLNAHDGTSSYRMMAGVFRSICTNSMICMEDDATDIRVPHKGNIIEHVIEGSFTVINESSHVLDHAAEWQGLQLSHDERGALAEAAHVLRFGALDDEEAPEGVAAAIKPAQLLAPRRQADAGTDLWRVHNVLQENVIRGGLAGRFRDADNRVRRATTREVKAIDGDVRLNRALWVLSQRMAEIKGMPIAA